MRWNAVIRKLVMAEDAGNKEGITLWSARSKEIYEDLEMATSLGWTTITVLPSWPNCRTEISALPVATLTNLPWRD